MRLCWLTHAQYADDEFTLSGSEHEDGATHAEGTGVQCTSKSSVSSTVCGAGKKASINYQHEKQIDQSLAKSTKRLAESSAAKVDILSKQLELQERQVKIAEMTLKMKKDAQEMHLMTVPTAAISDHGLKFLELKQKQILQALQNEVDMELQCMDGKESTQQL